MCLDANGKGTTNGTKVDDLGLQRPGQPAMAASTPTAPSPASSPGSASTSPAPSTTNGALVELWTCNGQTNQQWTLN